MKKSIRKALTCEKYFFDLLTDKEQDCIQHCTDRVRQLCKKIGIVCVRVVLELVCACISVFNIKHIDLIKILITYNIDLRVLLREQRSSGEKDLRRFFLSNIDYILVTNLRIEKAFFNLIFTFLAS